MKKYALLSSLLLMYAGSAFSAPTNLSGNITVSSDVTKTGDENAYQSDGTGFFFHNNKNVSVENGYGIYMNGIYSIVGTIDNIGHMIVTGTGEDTGYSIFSTSDKGRSVRADIINSGIIERIGLRDTDESSIINTGYIKGQVLLGTDADISNQGRFENKTVGGLNDNLIQMGKNAEFINGVYHRNPNLSEDYDELFSSAKVFTDNIDLSQNSLFENGGEVENESFVFAEKGSLINYMTPFLSTPEMAFVRTIDTGTLRMGNEAVFSNEMGGVVKIDGVFTTGDNSFIENGSYYSLDFDAPQVPVLDENGNVTDETEDEPEWNKFSTLKADRISVGKESSFYNLNAATVLVNSFVMGDDAVFENMGGIIVPDMASSTGREMIFGNNTDFWSYPFERTEPRDEDPTAYIPTIRTEQFVLGNNSSFNWYNGDWSAGVMEATSSMTFGNDVLLEAGNLIYTPVMTFGDRGEMDFAGLLRARENSPDLTTLTMGKDSVINAKGIFKANTYLGSNSVVNLTNPGGVPLSLQQGGTIEGSLQGVQGATNVHVDSMPDDGWYTMLAGFIDVDSINIKQNEMRLSCDVKGVVNMHSDTILRFVGQNVYIHDPIQKVNGATNTTLIIDLDNSISGVPAPTYGNTNTVTVDHIILASGGFNVNYGVTSDDIKLDSDTVLRLNGNFKLGAISEFDNEAVNTTFAINVGQNGVLNSSGIIVLDRVALESGTFNVYHKMKAGRDEQPVEETRGIELSSNTRLNVYSDVEARRFYRADDTVTNTNVFINNARLTVDAGMDVDNLLLNKGAAIFRNLLDTEYVSIKNGLTIGSLSSVVGKGKIEVGGNGIIVEQGGKLLVSEQSVSAENPIEIMNIEGNLTTQKESTIDLRTNAGNSDKITVTGTLTLGEDTILVLRNMENGVRYNFMSVGSLNGSLDNFRRSWLWNNPEFTKDGNELYVQIDGMKTLQEGISSENPSKNEQNVANALDQINLGFAPTEKMPDFLERALYAEDANQSKKLMKELSGEGYASVSMSTLHMLTAFNRNLSSVLREIRGSANNASYTPKSFYDSYGSYGYGRSGGDVYYYRTKDGYLPYYQNSSSKKNAVSRYQPISAHSSSLSYGYKTASVRDSGGGFWLKPFYSSYSQDDTGDLSGYETTNYGATVGFDVSNDDFSFGLTGLYATGEMEQNDKVLTADTDTFGVGFYLSTIPEKGNPFFDFYATWMQTSYNSKRNIAMLYDTLKADFDVTTYAGGVGLGYQLRFGNALTLIPRVGVDYASVQPDDFKEKGTSDACLNVKNDAYNSIKTPVEITAVMNMGDAGFMISPAVYARWAHEFGDTETTFKSSFEGYTPSFDVTGIEAQKDNYTLGGSLTASIDGQLQVFASYDYDFNSSMSGHVIQAGLVWNF